MYSVYLTWLITAPFARVSTKSFTYGRSRPTVVSFPYSPYPGQECAPEYAVPSQPPNGEWLGWGADVSNNRWANGAINSSNAAFLTETCSKEYAHGQSAVAVVQGGVAYYPTWSGLYVALDYKTCTSLWEINVTALILEYAPLAYPSLPAVARTSAALDADGSTLYFGTQAHALLFAVDRSTGSVIDKIQINSNPVAIITQSPTTWQGTVFVGASSFEENIAGSAPGYKCCSFIGNFAAIALNRRTQKLSIVWNQSMAPQDSGFSGVAVWGSQPAIDFRREQVLIATGNIYDLPEEYEACQNQTANITVIQQGVGPDPCTPRNVYQESVIAFDIRSGIINWVTALGPLDAYNVACVSGVNTGNCPPNPGPDTDFGMAPTFISGSSSTPYGKDIVVVGQKSGNLYALSAQAGTLFWATATSPDGLGGGLIWGIAVDDSTAYFTAANTNGVAWQPTGEGRTINNTAFGAASLLDGKILWETQSPLNSTSYGIPSVVNDVVLTGYTGVGAPLPAGPGGLVALDKKTGVILRNYVLNNLFWANIAIVDDYIMFGVGYQGVPGNGSFNVWHLS